MQGGHPQHPQGGHPQQDGSGLYPPQQGGHPQQDGSGLYPPQQQGGHPHEQSGLYPPQQQGYPPQGYPPQQGYGHYPQPGRPKGKGKLIAIIVVVAALAAGGIVLAVVLSKRNSGGGGGGGFDSGEALVKATLEALVAGDGDKLLSFTPPTDVALAALDCPAEAKAENEKQIKQSVEETKKKLADAASKMKGSGATFKSSHTDGIAKQEMKAGGDVGPCKAKVSVVLTGVGIDYDFVNPSDKSKQEHKTTFGVMILDGTYYLLDTGQIPEALGGTGGSVPTTPDTPPDTPQSPELAAAKTDLDQLRAEACACPDRTCADQVLVKRKAFAEKYATVPGVMDDPAIQTQAEETMKCISAKLGGSSPEPPPIPPPPDPNAPPPQPPAPGKALPECEAYAKAAERFIKCNKVPKQSRDAVQTAVDSMRKTWSDASMTDEMRQRTAETCVTLEKSMKDAAAAIGCK